MANASLWARPNTVVRFVGYKPLSPVSDTQFITTWRSAVEQEPQPAGLLYRELCRQVPEWNAQIIHEMQNPNPYDFIEYTIFNSDADPIALSPLPDDLTSHYELVEGLFTIEYSFLEPEREGQPEMILFNCFDISGPTQVEQKFLQDWPVRAERQSQQEGFFSAILHRRLQPETTIAAFNRAEWQNIKLYVDYTRDFERLFPRAGRTQQTSTQGRPPIQSYLGLFRIVATVEGPTLQN